MKSFISRTVDFAASDAAMTDEQIGQVDGGVVLLPMTAGEIVLAYNLPGVTELKLPREVYPLIFLGEVTSWNDPRIVAANPGVTLPDTPITAVRRSDASGTDLRVHQPPRCRQREVQEHRGAGHQPAVAGRQQSGRRPAQRRRDGHDHPDAGCDRLHRVGLRQADQHAGGDAAELRPATSSPRAARAARWPWPAPSSRATICAAGSPIPKDAEAYPIATFTWMLFYKKQEAARAEALRNFVTWALNDGQAMADAARLHPAAGGGGGQGHAPRSRTSGSPPGPEAERSRAAHRRDAAPQSADDCC